MKFENVSESDLDRGQMLTSLIEANRSLRQQAVDLLLNIATLKETGRVLAVSDDCKQMNGTALKSGQRPRTVKGIRGKVQIRPYGR